MDACELLQQIAVGNDRSESLSSLNKLVKSGEIRDSDFSNLYAPLFEVLLESLRWVKAHTDTILVESIFLQVVQMPEFDSAKAAPNVKEELVQAIMLRIDGAAPVDEWPNLGDLLHFVYDRFPFTRSSLRNLIGQMLRKFGRFSHKSVAVAPVLKVLGHIIAGFKGSSLSKVHKSLLFELVLPLHRPSEWLSWDRQTTLISTYHKELVFCIMKFLDRQPSLVVRCLETIFTHFPQARDASTPKEVLLLHEIGQLFKYLDPAGFREILPQLSRLMIRFISSQNAQPIQSVLQWWKDEHFVNLCKGSASQLIPQLLSPLVRGGEPFWNPTVNRMTALVLEKLEASDPATFSKAAEDLWGTGREVPAFEMKKAEPVEALGPMKFGEDSEKATGPGKAPNVASLNFRMGGWKPPAKGSSAGTTSGQPPATITGVAPWAFSGAPKAGPLSNMAAGGQPPATITGVAPWAFSGAPKAGPLSNMAAGGPSTKSIGAQPPSTITGVAPWAFSSAPKAGPLSNMAAGSAPPKAKDAVSSAGGGAPLPSPQRSSLGSLNENAIAEGDEEEEIPNERPSGESAPVSGLSRIREFAKLLCPDGSGEGGERSWEAALMAETPTLLPTLKFHELVFGSQDLGSGAFSVVRYARTILKGKTQSDWPEYAVKVINTKTMEELGYETSVNREICVLKMCSHPGIARMVSAFRWRDGAYLVLEYAAKGDLHSILVAQGSLTEDATRFISGEVVAALVAIHDAGFLYGDLKPENVVVSNHGHAKVTDFGGCRPITEEAKAKTRQSMLKRLRDGDWRAPDTAAEADPSPEIGEDECLEDDRVEGTTLYLPPEVVKGAAPTLATDSWALGCLVYQLLKGKPPIWAESEREQDLQSRIVSFDMSSLEDSSTLSQLSLGLIGKLLDRDASTRLSVAATALDDFYKGEDVFAYYKKPRGPELAQGEVAPQSDARWQKRQYSKIWTVMPTEKEYAFTDFTVGTFRSTIDETDVECDIPFGDSIVGQALAPIDGGAATRAPMISEL